MKANESARSALAVDRDPSLRRRLLGQFDRGANSLRGLLADRFGAAGLDRLVITARREYETVIGRLPWIGGSANPRSFSIYGSALWLALWRTLKPHNLTVNEARTLFCEMFRQYWSRYPRWLRRLYGSVRMGPRNQHRTQRLAVLSEQRKNSHDYVYRFVPGESGRFDFGIDIVECAIIKFLRTEGAEELAPVLCELDWPNAELIGVVLERTTTLAGGGERCDFRFRRAGAIDFTALVMLLDATVVAGVGVKLPVRFRYRWYLASWQCSTEQIALGDIAAHIPQYRHSVSIFDSSRDYGEVKPMGQIG